MRNAFDILRSLKVLNLPTNLFSFVVSIVISFLFSILIALMYRFFFERQHTGSGVERAFPIIGPSVTTIFLAIQFSLPLSLGLLGALSFVRFRTPIKQPEEVGYILLLIACSIGCATFNFTLVSILIFVILVALFSKRFIPKFFIKGHQRGLLLISLREESYQGVGEKIDSFVRANLISSKLESVSINDGMASLFYRFKDIDEEKLGDIAGKLKETTKAEKVNVFLEGVRTV